MTNYCSTVTVETNKTNLIKSHYNDFQLNPKLELNQSNISMWLER